MAARLAAFLLALLAAGCIRPPGDPSARETGEGWFFMGSFTSGYTQDDVRAVCEVISADDECVMGMSEPPVYGTTKGSRAACEDVRARVLAVPHVARVEACRRVA